MAKGRGRALARRWLLLMPLLCLVVGCHPRPLPGAAPVQTYEGTWEYRYGDAPAIPQDGWQAMPVLEDPPGRSGQNFLWMRTRLVGPTFHDPVLFFVDIDQSYEAYLDGKLIERFGPMEGTRYVGLPKIYLPLGADYAGKLLVLRIYSPYNYIGVFGTPRIGGRTEMVMHVIDVGIAPALCGLLLIVLGCVAAVLFVLRRSDRVYLYYAGFAISMGVHVVARSIMRDLLVDLGPRWTHIELLGGAVGWASVSLFIGQLFYAGRRSLLHVLGWALLGALGICIVLVATGLVHVWRMKPPLEFCLLPVVGSIIVTAIAAVRRGEFDGKILAIGVFISGCLSFFELLMLIGIVPRFTLTVAHYTAASFVLCLAILLALRFVRIHRRLSNYSTVLQLSLSQARVLEPGQHMQVALGEVLRLLGGDRALLFELGEGQKDLKLMAGRSSRGNALDLDLEWDSTLIGDVQRKKRPQVILRERDSAELSADRPPRRERLSIAAAPLLARGELVGTLYLESEAGRHLYDKEDMEILLGLCNQVALTLMTTRAVRLELEGALARRRLAEQEALLQAAGRMAGGDLQSVIAVPPGELAVLAEALEAMRKDLRVKFQKLETSNSEIQKLNEELRRQIEHRSHRLMEIMLRNGEREAVPAASQVMPGRMLGEHYKVVRTLGKGAMGSVFEVERTSDQLRLAAKVLSEQSDRTALLRFAREAQILARLDHPNLVAISDIDITAQGVLFLVMELVRGTTLKLCRERYRDIAFATSVTQQMAAGLNAIHARGIIHRGAFA